MSGLYADYDLHLHSLWSYDACAPLEYYFARAQELKLRAFAVTDHHNFDAFDELRAVAWKFPGVGFIPGAEMTVQSSYGVFDLVCLGLSERIPERLRKIFDFYRKLMQEWGASVCQVMQGRGHDYSEKELLKLLRIYRPERVIAEQGTTLVHNCIQQKYLFDRNYVCNAAEYWQFMGEVTGRCPALLNGREIIEAVHEAGGIVLIAHPDGYFNGMDEKRMEAILEELPLDGIECAHTQVLPECSAFYRKFCVKHKLLSSGGTDCHADPQNAGLNLSPGCDMARHGGESRWLDELLERVTLWNV